MNTKKIIIFMLFCVLSIFSLGKCSLDVFGVSIENSDSYIFINTIFFSASDRRIILCYVNVDDKVSCLKSLFKNQNDLIFIHNDIEIMEDKTFFECGIMDGDTVSIFRSKNSFGSIENAFLLLEMSVVSETIDCMNTSEFARERCRISDMKKMSLNYKRLNHLGLLSFYEIIFPQPCFFIPTVLSPKPDAPSEDPLPVIW